MKDNQIILIFIISFCMIGAITGLMFGYQWGYHNGYVDGIHDLSDAIDEIIDEKKKNYTPLNVVDEKEMFYSDIHETKDPLDFDGVNDTYVIVGDSDNTTNIKGNWTHYRFYQYQIPVDALKLMFLCEDLDVDWSRWHNIHTDRDNNLFVDGYNTSLKYYGNLSDCRVMYNDFEYREICYTN